MRTVEVCWATSGERLTDRVLPELKPYNNRPPGTAGCPGPDRTYGTTSVSKARRVHFDAMRTQGEDFSGSMWESQRFSKNTSKYTYGGW